ncbi:hypothetical protein [Pontimicrobium sp. SW4]|uniref:Uncharacterized protein n=1 Tax=Pontimicrobium sp. SW4 TaxID=3153519 RepID=A0AAU7BVS5_9FLAO
METQNIYKSFNNEKTIEELQYSMLQYKTTLESFKPEYSFYKHLLKSQIFKSNVINLFEYLERFKKTIADHEISTANLIIEINSHNNQITKKIECDDLVCDNYFIKEYDVLENKIHTFLIEYSNFKLQMLPYLQSAIK